jgi:ABC-type amino acid transport substrate-binding protein
MHRLVSRRFQTALGLLVVVAAGCGSSSTTTSTSASPTPTLFSTVSPGQLTIATYGTDLPATQVTGSDIQGIDGLLLSSFEKEYHLTPVVISTTFASVILDVEEGKADIGMGYFYSTTRAAQVYYTLPYYETTASIITMKSYNYTGPNTFTGKIGAIVGEVWQPFITKVYPNVVLFQTDTAAATALLNGQIDGFVDGDDFVDSPPLAGNSNVTYHDLSVGDWGLPASAVHNLFYDFVSCSNKALGMARDNWTQHLQATGQLTSIYDSLTGTLTIPKPDRPSLTLPAESCSGA